MGGRLKSLFLILWLSFVPILFCSCGHSKEEKRRMEEIAKIGRENAVNYVIKKYRFIPEVEDIQLCMEHDDADPFPWANGYVLASMSYGQKKFKVHISGEEHTDKGRDDFQYELIIKEVKEYFEALLMYEIYDIYLEYQQDAVGGDLFPECHKDNMIQEWYEPGDLENFFERYSANIRIDDCTGQDLTGLNSRNPAAWMVFEKYVSDYRIKVVLISYRSVEDYEKGFSHTYGQNGLLDFKIWNDGLYIDSYASFEQEEIKANRFELQEYDGMIFSTLDIAEGDDLTLSSGEDEWMELGETTGNPVSKVYSIDTEKSGEVTVYIPADQYGENVSVFIQYLEDNKWRQYQAHEDLTIDKKYIAITYHGVDNGSFDFALFKNGF